MAKDFVQTESGHHSYYEYTSGKKSQNCMVFLNGLSDSVDSWATVVDYLSHSFDQYLLIDLPGQGKGLEKDLDENIKEDFKISVEEQSANVLQILTKLNIKGKIHLIGFSYGGGVATHFASKYPERIDKLFLLLPFIIRLDLSFPLARFWDWQFSLAKAIPGPSRYFAEMTEKMYGHFLNEYMHHRFEKRIHKYAYRKIAIELVEGIMNFDSFQILKNLPEQSVHLVTVDRDTLVPKSLYREFWLRLPNNVKQTWLKIEDGEHLILEQAPLFVAKWIEKVLLNQYSCRASSSETIFNGWIEAMETKAV